MKKLLCVMLVICSVFAWAGISMAAAAPKSAEGVWNISGKLTIKGDANVVIGKKTIKAASVVVTVPNLNVGNLGFYLEQFTFYPATATGTTNMVSGKFEDAMLGISDEDTNDDGVDDLLNHGVYTLNTKSGAFTVNVNTWLVYIEAELKKRIKEEFDIDLSDVDLTYTKKDLKGTVSSATKMSGTINVQFYAAMPIFESVNIVVPVSVQASLKGAYDEAVPAESAQKASSTSAKAIANLIFENIIRPAVKSQLKAMKK